MLQIVLESIRSDYNTGIMLDGLSNLLSPLRYVSR